MKKLLIAAVVAVLTFCFTSCEKGSGDVLSGVWKNNPSYTPSSGMEVRHLTFVFDGKGNFTFTNEDEGSYASGTYTIENNSIVRLHGTGRNAEGVSKEYDDVLEYDADSNPPTLTSYIYDQYGDLIEIIVYEKK